MNAKTTVTVWTLGACALAGVLAFVLKGSVHRVRKTHLDFDFPLEQALFV